MRLIDAEHLVWNVKGIKSGQLTVKYLLWILKNQEPTVDAVPVIRCKDCTYYRGDHEYCVNDMFAVESGFCNWAERKEE